MKKSKSALQVFTEGLKAARLRLTSVRGHYVTPEELGKDVGVSGQTIRNYESGESEPTFEMVEKLAEVTGVKLNWPPFGNVPVEPTNGLHYPATDPLPKYQATPAKKRRRAQ